MKGLFTLMLSLCVYGLSAQTTIYTQTFNGTYTDWSLNTSDLGGASPTDNQWIVNNIYAGYTSGICLVTVPATPNEPVGITGYPTSNYLHIYSANWVALCAGTANSNYDAGTSATFFAAMNTPIVTTGFTGVSFSFWWLCVGDATSYGKVYYRTASGGPWTAVPGGPGTYNLTGSWTPQSITNSAFDNQAFLEFGFQFNVGATGNDPAFAIDDIKVTGVHASTVAPVASFTSTPTPASICTDSCVVFTNTSTISSGSIDSFRWEAVVLGFPVLLGNTSPFSFCANAPYNVPGTYTIRLRVYGNGLVDSASTSVTVKAAPHPAITKAGKVLSVASTYSSYQWSNGSGNIAGATNNTYTYSVSGTYTATVDSGGCPGSASMTVSTAEVQMLNGLANSYWVDQSSGLVLHAAEPLADPLTVAIYDATGRQILNEKWEAGSNTKQINDISPSPGIYMIRLNNNTTSEVFKWLR